MEGGNHPAQGATPPLSHRRPVGDSHSETGAAGRRCRSPLAGPAPLALGDQLFLAGGTAGLTLLQIFMHISLSSYVYNYFLNLAMLSEGVVSSQSDTISGQSVLFT